MHVYKKSITHNPQDHPLQRYADVRIPLVSVLFKKVRGKGGGHLLDIMALGVGTYLGEGVYYRVGDELRKYSSPIKKYLKRRLF